MWVNHIRPARSDWENHAMRFRAGGTYDVAGSTGSRMVYLETEPPPDRLSVCGWCFPLPTTPARPLGGWGWRDRLVR
jgi:hypothetical protein